MQIVTHSIFTHLLKKLKIIRCINKAVSSCQFCLREWCSFCIVPVFLGLMWSSRLRRLRFDHDAINDREHVSFLSVLMLQYLHFSISVFTAVLTRKTVHKNNNNNKKFRMQYPSKEIKDNPNKLWIINH